jgi:hypothetical protein
MSNVPRDPRQLARDILAGKISIEELAREQQRRRAGQQAAPRPQARPQERVPMPRTAPPVQPQRPVIRQATPFPARPAQRPPQQSRPFPTTIPAPAPRQTQPRPMPQQTQVESTTAAPQAAGEPLKPLISLKPASAPRPAISRFFNTRASLRQGIIMAEILGKPVGLRDEW